MEDIATTKIDAPPKLYPGFLYFSLAALVPGSKVSFEVRLEGANPATGHVRLLPVLTPGKEVEKHWRDGLLEQGVDRAYAAVDDLEALQNYFFAHTQKALQSGELPPRERHVLVYENALCSIKAAMLDPRNGRRLSQGVATVRQLIDLVWDDDLARGGMLEVMARDRQLFTHSLNVCLLGVGYARTAGWPRPEVNSLGLALFFHDLGLAELAETGASLEGAINGEEQSILKNHPRRSHQFLSRLPGIDYQALDTVLCHHENLDGSGYPRRLERDALSPHARLARIVDQYESMTGGHLRHKVQTPFDTLRHMRNDLRNQLDQGILEKFVLFLGQA
jgi:HD-GYP domain-containing protein (c-di-GMP phosphodiesterase class II)